MRRHLAISILVISMAMSFFVLGGCKRSKPAPTSMANLIGNYYILDFRAPDEWWATHSVTATWRNRELAFPAVFRFTRGGHASTRNDDGSWTMTICRDPVTFNIQPRVELETLLFESTLILPPGETDTGSSIVLPRGEKIGVVIYDGYVPAGTTGEKAPSEAETEKLLQGPVINVE